MPESPTRRQLGLWGERKAAHFLQRRGYRILRTNYRAHGGGEADIVARDVAADTLCFIEVKCRLIEDQARPSRTVTPLKQRLILRAAASWLRLLDNPDITFRFDVVEIIARPGPNSPPPSQDREWDTPPGTWPRIRLLRNAFTPPPDFFY